jgi:hypothetical protein
VSQSATSHAYLLDGWRIRVELTSQMGGVDLPDGWRCPPRRVELTSQTDGAYLPDGQADLPDESS